MITLPLYYVRGHDNIVHRYYGNFLVDVVQQNRIDGLYGLTGNMLDQSLEPWGARLGDQELIFNSEGHKTLFLVRWA